MFGPCSFRALCSSGFTVILVGYFTLVAIGWCSVAFPRGAVVWPAVCGCGVFW